MASSLLASGRITINSSPPYLATISTFANQAAIAIQNAQLHQEVKQQAITDGLTGLYNFRYIKGRLEEEVKRAQRFKHYLALRNTQKENNKYNTYIFF
ncbi:unnamed protein product [marine sediment metagenome]|uniref:Uncharacterized protein n=1 Tax=marine sediment metagenome TaxID=412755 RepID=X0ZIE3_9ZZZZ